MPAVLAYQPGASLQCAACERKPVMKPGSPWQTLEPHTRWDRTCTHSNTQSSPRLQSLFSSSEITRVKAPAPAGLQGRVLHRMQTWIHLHLKLGRITRSGLHGISAGPWMESSLEHIGMARDRPGRIAQLIIRCIRTCSHWAVDKDIAHRPCLEPGPVASDFLQAATLAVELPGFSGLLPLG